MTQDGTCIAFGPATSRRVGRSLGIDNIPPTVCSSYACVYCKLRPILPYLRCARKQCGNCCPKREQTGT